MAKEVDRKLEIGEFGRPKMTKAERKAANKAAAKQSDAADGPSSTPVTGTKRTAEMAELEMPPDVARDRGPGSVVEQASGLAV